MNIQSLSIVVPTGKCWNHCPFCVSRMHCENYGTPLHDLETLLPSAYMNRMAFVRDEGCNSMLITGTAEPQQNLPFIYTLLHANRQLPKPFYNISMQTTGTSLTEWEIEKLAAAGVTTLAISLNSFDDERNWNLMNTPGPARTMKTEELIRCAKKYGMNVRVCLNLTDEFAEYSPEEMFDWAIAHDVDQLTFRKIYADGESDAAKWVADHLYPQEGMTKIANYMLCYGTPIMKLPFGTIQYSVCGISTVADTNCMSKERTDDLKYAILRPNGHLYSRWDDKGSLIF